MKYLFEVSWEVCNKVGGIHTVIATKAHESIREFGTDGYVAIGPDTGNYHEFIETDDDFAKRIRPFLQEANLNCKIGFWNIPNKPRVILIGNFKEKFNIDRLLYAYWEQLKVDSYEASWDYIEPVLFSTAAAEIIEAIVKRCLAHEDSAVAHFHEWMCGAGALYLEKNLPRVGTVFTTHATVLGRAMAHNNARYYEEYELSQNVQEKSTLYGVKNKHSIEAITAREVDCFTTVSELTGRESFKILGKNPDIIVYNGLNVEDFKVVSRETSIPKREKLLKICSKFLGEQFKQDTFIFISSGRYEFKNKGYDLVLETLAKLRDTKKKDLPQILMLFLVAADQQKMRDYQYPTSRDPNYRPIAISPVYNIDHDAIVTSTKHYRLDEKSSPVNVVFSTLYLDGDDGIFNMGYRDLLECADLSLFPSFYEPWGYTPLESAAIGVPTVTSDLAGFGHWVITQSDDFSNLVKVLGRKSKTRNEVVENFAKMIFDFVTTKRDYNKIKSQTEKLREHSDWSNFFSGYKTAYDIALAKGHNKFITHKTKYQANPFKEFETRMAGNRNLRYLELDVNLPRELRALNDLSYNLWWCWQDEAKELFSSINPKLWEYFDHNPVKLLKSLPFEELKSLATNQEFMTKFEKVKNDFHNYVGDCFACEVIDSTKPMTVYFSMEYGLNECLPIYSGGLGILSGDHLKAASDLNMDLMAVGLYYHQGYFQQEIGHNGYQVEHYPYHDWKDLPLKVLINQYGETVKIPVYFADRDIWLRVLVAHVGRVPLFLFDANIDENRPEDRFITAQLYIGDRDYRLKQEKLIAVAGMRLVMDVLKIEPRVYHLNEGHCAFIAFERVRRLCLQGYSFNSAIEEIKANTVFTTHTPVPAGNEVFEIDKIRAMFSHFFTNSTASIEQFIELGHMRDGSNQFSMTVLAINTSSMTNAVSKLHGEVSREMWKSYTPPNYKYFGSVTNGVHYGTWVGREIKNLSSHYRILEGGRAPVEKVWEAHNHQKNRLLNYLKESVKQEYSRRGVDTEIIKNIIDTLDKEALVIGFARRFAEYKRASLIFSDVKRLAKILKNSQKPVILLFAGKSHPASGGGKELIQGIYQSLFNEDVVGNVIFLENYEMYLGSLLTQGSDIWLNNPVIRQEACGTSGMKAAMNGVLNCSIPDGWWAEGYTPEIGWSIPPSYRDFDEAMKEESELLYEIIEKQIVPMFYNRDAQGVPVAFTEMMQNSIEKTTREFSAERMLKDYERILYSLNATGALV